MESMSCSVDDSVWPKGKLFASTGDHETINNGLQKFGVASVLYKFSNSHPFSVAPDSWILHLSI